ncbi:hypothetical protein G7W60_06360 [Pseudomonas fluorescens]|uniref:hypothetical protein n=1 Tax=Pseudomonas fluorescens TaxID=294 RepID=UPI0014045A50|nr:hypothetical protein [Pseudomonas fluorescens]NHN67454.1 hypothetical protein [Pseudomonas fluorescens]
MNPDQTIGATSNQLVSKFDPPDPPAGSDVSEAVQNEKQAYEKGENQAQKRKHNNEIHGLRVVHAWLLFGLTIVWIFVIWIVILFQGFGRWFVPMLPGFEALHFKLSDAVLIAFMTTTTATVLGLYGIAAYWMYGRPKTVEGKTPSKKGKKA